MKLINPNKSVQKGVLTLLTICLVATVPALGDYEIVWSTIDGGGQSSGGSYVLTGTIGQPEEKGIQVVHNARFYKIRQMAKQVD